jgi:hypothetical protein
VLSKSEKLFNKKLSDKIYRENNKEKIKKYQKEYRENNKIKIKEDKRRYQESESYKKYQKGFRKKLKTEALTLLGGCKCVICGETNLDYLTIDHIDGTGHLDNKNGFFGNILYGALINGSYPKERISNLRVLCFNHNCSLQRNYLDLPYEKQTNGQRYQTKLWKEAFAFFGPCKTCGESNLKFLTISHIHDDGAERRRNGERTGRPLLTQFRKSKWPESIKQDYCFECYNCNCSK